MPAKQESHDKRAAVARSAESRGSGGGASWSKIAVNREWREAHLRSTYSTNVPLRLLIYFVNDLERYFSINHKDLFRRKRIMISTPHFVVFYNGVEPREEVEEMRLSASFCHETDEPELELICRKRYEEPSMNVLRKMS